MKPIISIKKNFSNQEVRYLHLNLKKKWFDMILSGKKTEEYREIKDYWITRLFVNHREYFELQKSKKIMKETLHTHIIFSNGYSLNRPQFVIELKGIEINTGVEKWGAKKDVKYFILKLGKPIKQ